MNNCADTKWGFFCCQVSYFNHYSSGFALLIVLGKPLNNKMEFNMKLNCLYFNIYNTQ